jgi:hypothetical protein
VPPVRRCENGAVAARRRPKRPRWGLRAVGFLLLGVVAIVTSNLQGHHTFGTLGCLVIAFVGAWVCTARGLASDWMPRREAPVDPELPSDP